MHTTKRTSGWMLLALGAGWACSGSTSPEEKVASIALNKQTVALDAVGATEQLTATPRDNGGATVSGVTVSWSTSDPNVVSVTASGQIAAVANGSATVTASAGSAAAQAAVTVAQVARQLTAVAGGDQTGTVGQTLPESLVVEVADRLGNVMAGVTVAFAPDQASSAASPTSGATDAGGRAKTSWTLGTKSGIQRLTATPDVGSGSVVVSASAQAGPADSLLKVSGDGQTGATGTAVLNPLVIKVTDQFGNAVAGHAVTFAETSGGGSVDPTAATTGIDGRASTTWTLGTTEGTQTARAEAVNAAAAPLTGSPAVFTATASNGVIQVNDGSSQVGLVAKPVNIPPSVKVTDGAGQPIAGVPVSFQVQSGNGSVTGAVQLTDTDGIARVGSWTLGASAGGNGLTASANAAGSPVSFTATGETAQYDIDIEFLGTVDPDFQPAFTTAKARWEQLVFGDLVDAVANLTAAETDFCGMPGAINKTIDDILIFARVDSIDGPAGVLGRAGPCYIRDAQEAPDEGKPVIGRMVFDSADVRGLLNSGNLENVILHEMGHVLGIGALWDAFVVNPSCDFSQDPPTEINGQDTRFNGPRAIQAFDMVGGTNFTGGKVPVENEQGTCEGTRDTHWRESVLGTELMTGFLQSGSNPLSIVTLGSMWDQGYKVNYSDADAYQLILVAPPALLGARGAGSGVALIDDVYRGPVFGIAGGRVTRVLIPGREP